MNTPRLGEAFLTRPIAHRALHDVTEGRPENSIEAIEAAIAHGYGIEIDVQLSADDQAMVFHDYDLDRLTSRTGPVHALSAKALRAVPLSGGQAGIPDLAQVLDLVAGQVPLLIEIKDQDGQMGPDVGPLEQAVARALERYAGPVALMSFNPHSAAFLAQHCPAVPRGLVTSAYDPGDWTLPPESCDRLREIPDYARVGASFISHQASDLGRARVAQLKADGADILCWTIRSPEEEAKARQVAQNVTFEGYLPDLAR